MAEVIGSATNGIESEQPPPPVPAQSQPHSNGGDVSSTQINAMKSLFQGINLGRSPNRTQTMVEYASEILSEVEETIKAADKATRWRESFARYLTTFSSVLSIVMLALPSLLIDSYPAAVVNTLRFVAGLSLVISLCHNQSIGGSLSKVNEYTRYLLLHSYNLKLALADDFESPEVRNGHIIELIKAIHNNLVDIRKECRRK